LIHRVRRALPSCSRRHLSLRAHAWLLLSGRSSPGGAGEAAALVLAAQEFVANGGGRSSLRRRRSAASPGRRGSRGHVGRRGCWRSRGAALDSSIGSIEIAASGPTRKRRWMRLKAGLERLARHNARDVRHR